MLGLLSPWALGLAPLLAAPLILHFMGRARPEPRAFPSLLPVRGGLTRAMRRHRLKNWLQLLLRMLALACLLLAAANPVWRAAGFTPPQAVGILAYNGAYAAIPAFSSAGNAGEAGGSIAARQEALRRGLDSLTSGNLRSEKLFPDAPREGTPRFGRYAGAVQRLLARSDGVRSFHLYLPVFDARDLAEARGPLRHWLEARPDARLVLIDFTRDAARLSPFAGSATDFPREGAAALRVGLSASLAAGTAPLWTPREGAPHDALLKNDSAEIGLALPDSGWIAGELALSPPDKNRFAYPFEAFAFRVAPPRTLCYAGSGTSAASRASLGRAEPRLNTLATGAEREIEAGKCDFLYLADPDNGVGTNVFARAAETVRRGGKVIVQVGSRTDIALLNRILLVPLQVGRLTDARLRDPLSAQPQARALAALGYRAQSWGTPGTVRRQIGFIPDAGTQVLLSAGTDPILVQRRSDRGEILLWTTDLDDPDWTDLGTGPWPALLHPAFFAGRGRESLAGVEARRADADSTVFFPAGEESDARVFDPAGLPLRALHREPGGWRVGPFDRLGLYRIETTAGNAAETSWLAVGLPRERLAGPDARAASDLEGFRTSLGETAAARVAVIGANDDWRVLYGGKNLRLALLVLAALLLLGEGLISLRLAPSGD